MAIEQKQTGHIPVLLNEAIDGLAIKPDACYIDCTFGRGGHSSAILNKLSSKGSLIVIDKDLDAIEFAKKIFANDDRVIIVHSSFANLKTIAQKYAVYGKVQGILLDLGVSSLQIDNAHRGFSFMNDGPLDMRMDKTKEYTAAIFINTSSAEEMTKVFQEYGEERFAKRISLAIVKAREEEEITGTARLAAIIKEAHPRWEKHKHPATRVFQAIRIYINQELHDLNALLKESLEVLAVGGRIAVISFHSLEDRIVKNFMQKESVFVDSVPKNIPIKSNVKNNIRLKKIGRAIKPQDFEINTNIRARSAILRIGEKIQ